MLPNGGLPRQGGPSRSWSKEPFPVPVPGGGCNGQCPPPEVKAQWGVIRTDYTGGFKSQINSIDDMKRIARDLEDAQSEFAKVCQWMGPTALIDKVPFLGKAVIVGTSAICGQYNSMVGDMKTQISRAAEDGSCGTMDFQYNLWWKFTRQRCLF